MKTKKLFTLCLALTMVLSTMFVGAESVFADTADTHTKGAVITAAEGEDVVVTPVSMNGSVQPQVYKTNLYSKTQNVYVKINMPKAGTLQCLILANADTTVGLYEKIDGTENPLSTMQVPKAAHDEDYYIYSQRVSKAGTYYLVFGANGYGQAQSVFGAAYIAGTATNSNTTVKSGTTRYASVSGTGYRYYKITTTGTRYLTISFPEKQYNDSKYKVKLFNSSKKKTNLLKGAVTVNQGKNYVTYAGVPKGTYYIGVSTEDDWYGINIKSTKVSESSGSSKASAKRVYKGGSKSGIITATQSSSSGDWYKIVVGSSQYIDLEVTTKSGGYSGGIKLSWYDPGRSKASAHSEFYYGDPSGTLRVSNQYGGPVKPGTYYVKIQKYGSGSGYYKLKWV